MDQIKRTIQTLRYETDIANQRAVDAEEKVKEISQVLYERDMEIKGLNNKVAVSEARCEALEEELKKEKQKRAELEIELQQI